MHHEATACHVSKDIVDLLEIVSQILKAARGYIEKKKGKFQCSDVTVFSVSCAT